MRLANQLRWKFAAAAPVCGWADPAEAAANLREIPVWAFHGDADSVVPVSGTQLAIKAILAEGGNAKETIYPGVDHNSWDLAYASELPEWLLQHKR